MDEEIKILLVDDERMVRRSMEKTLTRAGFYVVTAEDTASALELFKEELAEEPFDLALLDLNMPNFEGVPAANAGLELLSELVKLQPTLPVVVLTAFDEVERAKDAVARGARAYFVKGREAGLLELVNEILGTEAA
ncbi:MAG TPA: response regulator [Anaerolineae bacterium]|nr:response regulator [Anaerolineae bacterium]